MKLNSSIHVPQMVKEKLYLELNVMVRNKTTTQLIISAWRAVASKIGVMVV